MATLQAALLILREVLWEGERQRATDMKQNMIFFFFFFFFFFERKIFGSVLTAFPQEDCSSTVAPMIEHNSVGIF